MAIFGKSDKPADLIRRVQNRDYKDHTECAELLQQILLMPGLKARSIAWMLGHPEPMVRECGQTHIRRIGGDDVGDALVREMVGKPSSIAQEIAMTLIQLEPTRVGARVGPLLHAKAIEQRLAALDIIACYDNFSDFLGHLKAAMRDPDAGIRLRAVKQLSLKPQDPTVRLLLQNLIDAEDLAIRQLAIETLAEHPSPDLTEAFLERLPHESTRMQSRMVAALAALARDPSARLEERVLPMLGDDSDIVRDAAVKLLREIPNRKQVIRSFIVFSQGVAHWVRDRCRETFLGVGRDVLQTLVELIHEGPPEIKVGAILLASDGKNLQVVPHLLDVLHSEDDWWVRIVAVDELARYPRPEVFDSLIRMVDDADVRLAVITALGTMRNPKAIRVLVPQLKAPEPSVRKTTIDAMQNFQDPVVIDALARVVLEDPAEDLRERALQTLETFGAAAQNVQAAVAEVLARRATEAAENDYVELGMVNPSL